MAGVYIHIPFCSQACHYCNFHFSTSKRMMDPMVEAIEKELQLQQAYLGDESIQTIYFGGGTPSLLSPREIQQLLTKINQCFTIENGAEVTLEGNPDDLTLQKLTDLKAIGVNRLSIGIQSFQNVLLRYLNRIHDANKAVEVIKDARKVGFDNLSIDLIYGIPISNPILWEKDLMTAMELAPEHIAAYCLTIEKHTVFGNWLEAGKLQPVDEEKQAEQFDVLVKVLAVRGYEQYEVSNFALPGYYSQHNSNYWKKGNYLGVGPAAHSYNSVSRQKNVAHNQAYIKAIDQQVVPFTREVLARADHINEYLMTGLRTKWGCDLSVLKNQYEYDAFQQHQSYIESMLHKGLAQWEGSYLKLTQQGLLLADKIASDLFVEE